MTIATRSYAEEIGAWRAAQEQALRGDEGWLTVVGLHWLQEGTQRIGSDPACEIILPAAPSIVGEIDLHNGTVLFQAAPGITALVNGQPVTTRRALQPDDAPAPDRLEIGDISISIIRRGQRIGARIRDRNSAARKTFAGRQWYAADEHYRIAAAFHPHATPRTIPITNILGDIIDTPSPGYVEFELGDHTYRLDATQSSTGGLFLVFRDRTNGSETYGGGRFLTTAVPRAEQVILDFNRAVSPACAFTPFATCPLPPSQNHLPIAIPAGERVPPYDGTAIH